MKNKIIIAVCIVLMFTPTYLAIASYIAAQSASVGINVVTKMIIVDLNGKEFPFDKASGILSSADNADKEDMIKFFMDLNEKASPEVELPDQLKYSESFRISFFIHDRETVYNYFFDPGAPGEAYFVDDKDKIFHINSTDASKFLLTQYARCLYPASREPVLTLANQSVIEPTQMVWRYINYMNEYSTASNKTNVNPLIETYKLIGGVLNLNFSVEPDYIFVKIIENGNTVFEDLYENISTVNLNADAVINVAVDAAWYDNSERGASGEAKYTFYADVQAQPAFYLGKQTIVPGDFIVVTGIHVDNPSEITFESEPSLDFTPVFFKDGDYVRALIPVSIELAEVLAMDDNPATDEFIDYKLKFKTYGSTQELTLRVEEKKFKTQNYPVSADTVRQKRTPQTLEAFETAMARTYSSQEPQRYWDDAPFIEAVNGKIRTGFGLYRKLDSVGEIYRHMGVDYIVKGTDTALAVSSGKVIYVGEQVLSGNIVVVDHGWGLKSTYCHLSAVSVAEGTIVSQGDVVGVVGSTGFTDGLNLHAGVSVFNVPVSPYPLWEEKIPMYYN